MEDDRAVRRFFFVLLDRFSLLPFAGAVDALRLANRHAADAGLAAPPFRWKTLASDGPRTVTSSAGVAIAAAAGLDALGGGSDGPPLGSRDTVIVCGGLDVREHAADRALLAALRRAHRAGARIGAICTGAEILAAAGLLENRRATIHWENRDSFAELHPDVTLADTVYAVDGRLVTSAGGTAAIDLMLRLIAQDLGPAGERLAGILADQMIHTQIRTESDAQRLSIPTRIGVRHRRLAQVLHRMEETLEEPLSPATLAAEVGLSTRQLERLFRRYLGRSPKRYYMELRLARARKLLLQSDMSVIDVAMACGFTSPSHFSKCYRAQYGITPYRERGIDRRAREG